MDAIIDRHARAVQGSVRVVAEVREPDLPKPTPCAGWTLTDLLIHMTVQHRGFAAAAAGDGADLSHWQAGQLDRSRLVSEYLSEYQSAAAAVISAFAAEDVLVRKFCLPEISTQLPIPAEQAIGFHLVDYVVHGWDVARTLGLGYDVDPDVLDTALLIAQAVPDDDERRRVPGAPFAPRIDSPTGKPLDRVLTLLGRDPAWRPGEL
ncbi:MAG TPA: TIGR03086 family metal-binding protein [Streptosporangiaceae bacterium]|jgi:uncharacterized protein (TIGR03086 family)